MLACAIRARNGAKEKDPNNTRERRVSGEEKREKERVKRSGLCYELVFVVAVVVPLGLA